ncbi:hypothetical protein [Intrasporangium flavum]|uniref:hypothetical protein n=1 Tax=Intrasporangium flavum TaxID=1428657 RepID=UPI00096F9F50|nr:hypothetical protein [Intrasporangium flavum]
MSTSVPGTPPDASSGSATSSASTASAATPSDPARAVAWALGVGLLATAGLAVLAWALLVMHAIGYGGFLVLSPESHVAPPDEHRYVLALATGACLTLLGGPLLAWFVARGPGQAWGAALVGIGAGVLAGVAGASALLLVLGIDPVGFVLGG